MGILLKRQLSEAEKEKILAQHGRKCFANGHEIPEGEQVQFDHIHAFSLGGASEVDNIAPMCARHNKEKGVLSLNDFRVKLKMHDFFKLGDKLTLKDLLEFLAEKRDIERFAEPVSVKVANESVLLESASERLEFKRVTCPITNWNYFYATLDVQLLDSDDEVDQQIGLQPRYLIEEKVFNLYRHFQQHPVLQPSIGRVVKNRIYLFDGQHKIAALLWNGRTKFECKIYIDPEIRLLNQTNIAAHDKFAQTRFYSSIMVLKLGKQFGADFENYKNLEDNKTKTESGFLQYLMQLEHGSVTKADANTRFRNYIYSSVLEHEDNKLKRLVSSSNRRTDSQPLTMDMLQKSLFSSFLFREPSNDSMVTENYRRDDEVNNLVRLMNMLDELALNSWNPNAGPSDYAQRRIERLIRSKSMMAWAGLLHDAICGKLDIHDAEAREKIFYRQLSEDNFQHIRDVVERLVNWKRWSSPENDEIDRILADNKTEVKDWLKKNGLTTGYLMGASE